MNHITSTTKEGETTRPTAKMATTTSDLVFFGANKQAGGDGDGQRWGGKQGGEPFHLTHPDAHHHHRFE